MQRRCRLLLLLALLPLGGCAGRAAAPAAAVRAERLTRLDSVVSDLQTRGLFTGGAVVAGWDGELAYRRGVGWADVARKVPLTPATAVDGGSLAKTFTAAAVLLLEADGVLALDDPVQRHLPEYPYVDTRVRDLIGHTTGGLPDYDWFWERVGETGVLTNAVLLELLARERPPLRHDVGERFIYDDMGFYMAALIVERVSGRPFETFLRERLWQPLGLRDAFARPARFADWAGTRTLGYRPEADSLALFDVWDREGVHGGSNLYLSADDLFRWFASIGTRPPLPPSALRTALSAATLRDGRPTGITLGSFYASDDSTRFQYSGHIQAFHSVGYVDRARGFAFAFVSNTSLPPWLQPQLPAAIAAILSGDVPPPLDPPTADAHAAAQIAGGYDVPGVGYVTISIEGERRFVRVDAGPLYAAFPVDASTLYVPGRDAWLSFSEPAADGFARMRWSTAFGARSGSRSVKVLPTPTSLSTASVPPSSSASDALTARPSPVPP